MAALIALGACDQQGRPIEWPGLDKLKPGESTEMDVRQVLGLPDRSIDQSNGGKQLQFPKGPEGVVTFFAEIGPDGKLIGVRNVLKPETFSQVRNGMSQIEVTALLGRSSRQHEYPLKQQTTLEWKFAEGSETKYFVVFFDQEGKVESTMTEDSTHKGA
jgi:outer membrane protein assembly factor BamE (lipoprotein component of BamABCDE complex)